MVRSETDLYKFDWGGVIDEFSEKIKENIGAQCHDTLVPEFSTSTNISRVACEICLMDAMKSYFEYILCGGCGISAVRLAGTLEDW